MNRKLLSIGLMVTLCSLGLLATAAPAETIYWTDRGSNKIQRWNLDGSGVEDLVVVNVFEPVAIALDLVGGKLYWTEASPGDFLIARANLDGTNVELLTPLDHLVEPSGIALDVTAGKLYVTDVGTGKILRANFDGTGQEVLVSDPSLDPVEIALDVPSGKMYWTGSTPGGSMVFRANLDGTNVEDLVTGLINPSGIALNAAAGKVYWTDVGAGKIQRANLDGTGVEDVITVSVIVPVRIALDLSAGKLYWTEGSPADFMISRANLDGSNLEFLVTGLISPSGIALMPGPTTSVDDGALAGGLSGIRLSAAPNPSRSGVRLSGVIPSGDDLVGHLMVLDVAGRVVYRSEVRVVAGRVDLEWRRSADSAVRAGAGVYHIQLRVGALSGTASVVLLE